MAARVERRPIRSFLTVAPRFRWRQVGLGLAMFFPLIGLAIWIASLVTPATSTAPLLTPGASLASKGLYLAAAAFFLYLAALAEEMLFRGFALTAWRQLVGVRGAIVRSSIVFVLAHVLFVSGDTFSETVRVAFVAGVARIPVAFALGWLFVRTGSIWGPIGLHAAFNGILIALAEAAARAG